MLPRSCAGEGQGWPDSFGQGTSNIKLKLPDTKTLDYHDGGREEDPQDDIRTGGGDTNPTQQNWLLVSKRVPLLRVLQLPYTLILLLPEHRQEITECTAICPKFSPKTSK